MSEAPGGDADAIVIGIGGAVIGIGAVVRVGASTAAFITGGSVGGGLSDWLIVTTRLARGRDPRRAWGDLAVGLPSPWIYWTMTALSFVVFASVFAGMWWVWKRLARSERRERFGQPTEARQARRADVTPLVIDSIIPPTGRMLLGRMAGSRTILATEDRTRHPLSGKAARRQGNRGSVALIGPTGSGKTALAASAIATWNGPVVAVSVKRDLYDTTALARARVGEIAVFDPGGATGLPTARWSPLEAVDSSSAALRTGRALAQAIPRGGVTNADYWAKHGEKLLGAFMAIAGLSRLVADSNGNTVPVTIEQLATWVTTMAGNTDPVIGTLIRNGLDEDRPSEVRLLARHALVTFNGMAKEDHKIRSSIYATAALALDPWLEPSVAHSASDDARRFYSSGERFEKTPRMIDLDWLMGGGDERSNTLYLAASQPEFERLSPVLGGLLADLKDTIHAWDIAGRPLEKPLLIVIDEAGQLELGWLPAEVSTIAALGAFFVTCWQSLAQMQHRYGTLADAVLSGHRTKCFFAGVDDLATTRYVSSLLGHEHVRRRSWSRDTPRLFGGGSAGRQSVSETDQREEFAPANALREMYPGQAVLLHGTLPPIHLEAVRWWKERQVADLVQHAVPSSIRVNTDPDTCPLGCDAGAPSSPSRSEEDHGLSGSSTPFADAEDGRFDGASALERIQDAGVRCDRCGERVREGEARIDRRNNQRVVVCVPPCVATVKGDGFAPDSAAAG